MRDQQNNCLQIVFLSRASPFNIDFVANNVFKCINGLAPIYLLSEFKHARLKSTPIEPDNIDMTCFDRPSSTTKYQGSFRINGAHVYKSLPREKISVSDLNKLKLFAKRFFKRQ